MNTPTNDKAKTILNWSSGKDASLAYHLLTQAGIQVSHLLTTLSADHDRVFMHGIRETLLDMQAERMGLPLVKIKLPASPNDELYKAAMHDEFSKFKEDGVTTAAYGDIFLEDLRTYREQQLATAGIKGNFPLWKKDTRQLIADVEDVGIEALIVCVSEKYLDKSFLGRKINRQLLKDLPANVDPCGENGEFHTFVYNAPFFSAPIDIVHDEVVYRNYAKADGSTWDTGFYFLDVLPE